MPPQKNTVMTVLVITVLINMMLHINERFAVDIFFVTAIHCHVAVIATVNLLRIFGGVFGPCDLTVLIFTCFSFVPPQGSMVN